MNVPTEGKKKEDYLQPQLGQVALKTILGPK